jgi:hypothetical protein
MMEDDHVQTHLFEDSMPMDLGTFVFDGDEDLANESYDRLSDFRESGLPSLPDFSEGGGRLPVLPIFGRQPREDTFGGEKLAADEHVIAGQHPHSYGLVVTLGDDEVYTPQSERVQPYYGPDEEGICHAILVGAGYAGITSPLNLRKLVSQAIAGGPLSVDKRQTPIERYRDNEDFSSAYVGLSMSAYAGPSGLVLKLPGHCLVLLACGSEIVLIDPRDQPAKPSPTGLPQLLGQGALVMRCRDHLEVSGFIRSHYQTKPASAELFLLRDPQTSTKEVTQSVETLSLDPPSRAVVDALDTALGSSSSTGSSDVTFDSLNQALLGSLVKDSIPAAEKRRVDLTTLYHVESDEGVRTMGGLVFKDGGEKGQGNWQAPSHTKKLKDLFDSDPTQAIREDPVLKAPVSEPEKKNPEGKRERTPPTPPAAMGSPVRMESDDEGADKPKRAKTPPLTSGGGAAAAAGSAAPLAPSAAAVKTERRKSAPKTARTSGTTTVAAVPAAVAKKAADVAPK